MKVSVKWETDGANVDLPSIVEIPKEVEEEYVSVMKAGKDPDEIITNYLSDTYGFLVREARFIDDRNKGRKCH